MTEKFYDCTWCKHLLFCGPLKMTLHDRLNPCKDFELTPIKNFYILRTVMNMNNVGSIVICRDRYKSQEEFESAIKDAVMVLLNNEYIMTIRWDEKGLGIVAIEFNYDSKEFGDAYPYWLMPEQYESIEWDD